MNILFIGGDKRMTVAYDILKEKYDVSSLGLFNGDNGDVGKADVLLFPVPTTKDGKTVFAPLTDTSIPLDIVKSAKRGAHIITCGYEFSRYPQTDYSKLDGFCIRNAVSTAEGAIAFATDRTDFTLFGSKVLIIGFGRVAKALLTRLSGFGADITVSARKSRDFAILDTLSVKHIKTADAPSVAKDFDIIFNTVDVALFGEKSMTGNAFLFDLSSKGCVNLPKGEMPPRFFKLPGIPGKTAPLSAGKIIAETVDEIIKTQ